MNMKEQIIMFEKLVYTVPEDKKDMLEAFLMNFANEVMEEVWEVHGEYVKSDKIWK